MTNEEFLLDKNEDDNFRVIFTQNYVEILEYYQFNDSLRTNIMVSKQGFEEIIEKYKKWKEAEDDG